MSSGSSRSSGSYFVLHLGRQLSSVVNIPVVLQDLPRRHLGSLVVDVVTVSSLSSFGIAPTMRLATCLTLLLAPGRRVVTRVVIDVMQGSHKVVTSRKTGRESVFTTTVKPGL